MAEFHSDHPEPLRKGFVIIDWSESVPRCGSVRVRRYTCACVTPSYELCSAGGLVHVRRTVRSGEDAWVSESPWMRAAEGVRLWESLLDGRAR
jgi:hypothetical protein